MSASRFLAWPPRAEAASLFILAGTFALTFILLYGGASALSAYVPWRVPMQLPLDARLPFIPGAAVIYLTIGPMLLAAPFVLRDLASFLPLFAALMFETAVAAVCFMLLPVDPPAIDCCEAGIAGAVFQLADVMNLERNDLPSLHVAFAGTLAIAFAPRAQPIGRVLLFAWAILTVLSTLLTRQHNLLDVVGGVLLTVIAWRVAGSWGRRPAVRAAFDVELLCLRNYARFIGRNRRYLVISLAVLAAGIPHWRRQRLVRTGFAFLQAVDDILDGDRASEREPLEVADELIVALESGSFAADELGRLGAAFRADVLQRGGPAALATAVALLERMCLDRERVLSARVSSATELADLHRATFRGSLDLMLIAADSPLRAVDVPELVEALGWCSTVRDLDDDLAHGLINIPVDVALAAKSESGEATPAAWLTTLAVRDWLSGERARGRELLDLADARLVSFNGRRGAALLRRFARSMRRYAGSAPRGHAMLVLTVALAFVALTGCANSIYNLKIPLTEVPDAAIADSPRVSIEDARPPKERRTHLGKEIHSCERWFGDDTFVPPKLVYLEKRIAERTRAEMQVHIRLTRFDIVEYCEYTPTRPGAASESVPVVTPAPTIGDTVVLRLAGEVNGMPFDATRQFDYGTLYSFPDSPSSSPAYRALLHSRLELLLDEIVNKVWRAEASRSSLAPE
ncbi:MAG TPA: phosphatase PAP2 family protein [Steroidobacteraceae bacterium]|nr:phosphatase PAP2 family protein [Steroidobacteraceae bacterium]